MTALTIDEAVEQAAKDAADSIEKIVHTGWYFGSWDQHFEVAMQRIIRDELAKQRHFENGNNLLKQTWRVYGTKETQ